MRLQRPIVELSEIGIRLAIDGGVEQQVRQQRVVAPAAREIMHKRRLVEPLAALDLDLVAIEPGVESRRECESIEFGRDDVGFERNVDLVAETEGFQETQ